MSLDCGPHAHGMLIVLAGDSIIHKILADQYPIMKNIVLLVLADAPILLVCNTTNLFLIDT
jgi:hypothetical protein